MTPLCLNNLWWSYSYYSEEKEESDRKHINSLSKLNEENKRNKLKLENEFAAGKRIDYFRRNKNDEIIENWK